MSNVYVGGQAVIEGVMMQSKDKRAIAVRQSNGKITLKKSNIKSWINEKKINKIPFIRGSFILIETMIEGIKSLNFSSEFFMDDEQEDAFDRFIKKIFWKVKLIDDKLYIIEDYRNKESEYLYK